MSSSQPRSRNSQHGSNINNSEYHDHSHQKQSAPSQSSRGGSGKNRMERFHHRARGDNENMTLEQHYSDFVLYTYSSETALLAFNLWTKLSEMGIFTYFVPDAAMDTRSVSIQLAFLFYKYQVITNCMQHIFRNSHPSSLSNLHLSVT